MSIKLLAIGNRILKDDMAALFVAEKLDNKLRKSNIQVIIGETDIEYCISNIEEDDSLIILDAYLAHDYEDIGKVRVMELNESSNCYLNYLSQHQLNIIKYMEINNIKANGIIIGIGVYDINFGLEFSNEVCLKIEKITEDVLMNINKYIGEI